MQNAMLTKTVLYTYLYVFARDLADRVDIGQMMTLGRNLFRPIPYLSEALFIINKNIDSIMMLSFR